MTEANSLPGIAGPEYAGLVTRGFAFALDVAIVQAAIAVIGAVIALVVSAFQDVAIELGALGVAAAAVGWALIFDLYLITFWSLTGQTPGMRILGIRVSTPVGANLRPRRGVVRVAGMVLAALPLFLGYLPILTSSKRQGLHDRMAGTVVRYVSQDTGPERHVRGIRARPSAGSGTRPAG